MKWDIKILVVFVLTILVYGGSYLFSVGKFAFPLHYVDLSIAVISLFFVLKTPFSQYSALMIPFGFSFTYLLFGIDKMTGGDPTLFMLVRDITIFLFAIFLLVRVFRKKDYVFRGIFLFFGLLVLGQLIFNGINFTIVSMPFTDLIKSIIGLVLCLLVFGKHAQGNEVKQGIKLMFVLIAMYCVRNIAWIVTVSDLFD
jgi:hypothetical protein